MSIKKTLLDALVTYNVLKLHCNGEEFMMAAKATTRTKNLSRTVMPTKGKKRARKQIEGRSKEKQSLFFSTPKGGGRKRPEIYCGCLFLLEKEGGGGGGGHSALREEAGIRREKKPFARESE